MPRGKSARKLNFKPAVTSFVPKGKKADGKITLLDEEIEAIHLMDVLGLYQEDAAKSMEVSRPTFTRIIKSARQKLATALVGGYEIELEDTKEDFVVAVCSSSADTVEVGSPKTDFIFLYRFLNAESQLLEVIRNPITTQDQKPAAILPPFLLEKKVNIFAGSRVGEGLKSSLISKGIRVCVIESLDELRSLFSREN